MVGSGVELGKPCLRFVTAGKLVRMLMLETRNWNLESGNGKGETYASCVLS